MSEKGPVYGVELIDTLPLGKSGMLQQMRGSRRISISASPQPARDHRVIDVTLGADVVIRRRSRGEAVVQQAKFLEFMKTAKELA